MRNRLAGVLVAGVVALVLGTAVPSPVQADSGDPVGSMDAVSIRNRGQWAVFGWAADPDAPSGQVQVHIYVNGQHTGGSVTHQSRPDVERAFPYAGPNAGFEGWVTAGVGDHVCSYAINQGSGSQNTTLGCMTIPAGPDPADPHGHVDLVDAPSGMVRLVGWAGDPDAPKNDEPHTPYPGEYVPTAIEVHLDRTVLDATQRYGTLDRPDVQRLHPHLRNAKGFDIRFPVLAGTHRVCAYAINSGRRGTNNSTLGCWTVNVPGLRFEPGGLRGSLDELRFGTDSHGTLLNARGWAWDPDGADPVKVTLRGLDVGGSTSFDEASTGEPRPDVQRAHPDAPNDTGFTVGTRVWLAGTARTREFLYVCAYGVDGSREVLLGCGTRDQFQNAGDP